MDIYYNGIFKKVYGVIYKITNTVNNKVYIGQTIQGFDKRYNNDIFKNTHNKYLKNDIGLFGIDNFNISPVFDYAITKDELHYKEEYWIKHYMSNNIEYGYNIQSGKHIEDKQQMLIYKDIVSKHKINRNSITIEELDTLLNMSKTTSKKKKSKKTVSNKCIILNKSNLKRLKCNKPTNYFNQKETRSINKSTKFNGGLKNINIDVYLNVYIDRITIQEIKNQYNSSSLVELESLLKTMGYKLSQKQYKNKQGYIITIHE